MPVVCAVCTRADIPIRLFGIPLFSAHSSCSARFSSLISGGKAVLRVPPGLLSCAPGVGTVCSMWLSPWRGPAQFSRRIFRILSAHSMHFTQDKRYWRCFASHAGSWFRRQCPLPSVQARAPQNGVQNCNNQLPKVDFHCNVSALVNKTVLHK
jgi:hypothetical protein